MAHVAAEAWVIQKGTGKRSREWRGGMEGDLPVGCMRGVPVPVCTNESRLGRVCRVEVGEHLVQDIVG